jgi:hypothetical protein
MLKSKKNDIILQNYKEILKNPKALPNKKTRQPPEGS